MSGDFWMGVAATVAFFMTLNAGTAIALLVCCRCNTEEATNAD